MVTNLGSVLADDDGLSIRRYMVPSYYIQKKEKNGKNHTRATYYTRSYPYR